MKRFHLLILAAALCVFLTVHVIWLSQDVRMPKADESLYLTWSVECYEVAQEGVGAFLSWFYKPHYQPVFYPCLAVPFYGLFGREADVALIGVNALVMILLVLSIYGIGCYLFDSRVGLIGALVAMCIPELVYQSRTFLTHWGMVGMVAASIFLLLKTEHFTRWGYSLLFGLILGLAALTRVYLPFYIIAPILWIAAEAVWYSRKEYIRNHRTVPVRRIVLQILNASLAFVIAALLAAPFYLKCLGTMLKWASMGQSREAALIASGSVSLLEQRLWYLLHLPENASLLITVLVIGGIAYAFWRRSRSALFLLWWFVGGSIALGFLGGKANFYFTPLYIPIALLGVHWLFQLRRPLRRVLLLFVLSLSIGQFFLVSWSTPQTATLSKILRLDGGIYSSRLYSGGHPRNYQTYYQTDYDYLMRHTLKAITQDLGANYPRRAIVSLLTGRGTRGAFSAWGYYGRLLDAPITFCEAWRRDPFDLLGKADYIVVLNREVMPSPGDPYTRPLSKFIYSSPPAFMRNFVILDDIIAKDGTTLRILKRVLPPDLDEYRAVFYGVFQDAELRDTKAYMRYVRFLPRNIWCLASGKGSVEPLNQEGVVVKTFIGGTQRGNAAPVEIRYPCNGLLNIWEPILSLRMKTNNKNTVLNVKFHATDGNDYLIRYLPGDGPVSVEQEVITYYLDRQYFDGEWHTIKRNLAKDIYEALGVHLEHIKYLTLSGSSYSVTNPIGKESVVEGPVGVREVNLESIQTKPSQFLFDPELGLAVMEGSAITSQGFKFERGEYVIDVVAKRESADGTYPTMTISVNDEISGMREIVDEFNLTAGRFKKYSSKRITVYVLRLLSISVSIGDSNVTNPNENSVKSGKVWIKKILVRKIIQGLDKFTSYILYAQWQGDRLAFVVEDGDRRVGVLSDKGLGTADEWHHVALTFGMDYKVKFYIDGQLAGTDTVSLRPFVRTRPLMLGAYVEDGSSQFYFNGVMSDVRIYNRALAESEIDEIFRQGSEAEQPTEATKLDLVKYWIFGEGEVQTSSVKLGDENVIPYGNRWKVTKPDGGFKFDGVDDYIEISDLGSPDVITDEFTISAWVKLDEIGIGCQVLVATRNVGEFKRGP